MVLPMHRLAVVLCVALVPWADAAGQAVTRDAAPPVSTELAEAREASPRASAREGMVREFRTPDGLEWRVTSAYDGARLVVTGPDELVYERDFLPVEPIRFDVKDLLDGQYRFELRVEPSLDPTTRRRLDEARQAGDTSVAADLRTAGVLPREPLVHSGYFRVAGRAVVDDPQREPATDLKASVDPEGVSDQDDPTRAQVIAQDLIVQGSACVGLDCVSAEAFGFDTIRLKENNTRIRFFDTSNSGSFPTTDWQLTANESLNGGVSKFSIDDLDSGRTPFTVEANAPTNSLYVDDGGRIGLGTNVPVVEVHTVDGDTPTLRLQQDGSSGFTPQVWDVAGNEANFFVRDVTNGSRLPFKIRPGAPTDSLVVDADGDVGIGILTATAPLHVATSGTEAAGILLDQNGTPGGEWALRAAPDGSFSIGLGDGSKSFITLKASGAMATSGAVNAMSDRASKTGFAAVDTAALLAAVAGLDITRWSFVAEGPDVAHIGPTAQDFRAAFGLGEDDRHITLTDLGGVALAAIQGLLEQIEVRDRRIEELEERLEALESRLPPAVDAP